MPPKSATKNKKHASKAIENVELFYSAQSSPNSYRDATTKLIIKDVSSGGNNCFFRALVGCLGKETLLKAFNLSKLSTTALRTKLADEYIKNKEIHEQIATVVEIIGDTDNPSTRVSYVMDTFSLHQNEANCYAKENIEAVKSCLASEIRKDTMVSQISCEYIKSVINTYLSKTYSELVILTWEENNLDNLLTQLRDKLRRTDKKLYFLFTNNAHFKYLAYYGNDGNLQTALTRDFLSFMEGKISPHKSLSKPLHSLSDKNAEVIVNEPEFTTTKKNGKKK